ncbi:imelysin [Leptospira sp. 2 VSF19]|uniref:Imelysin n=1 Tax=Leptospira soteropolitanensis TaxID=2950025 RepID=A0AAW5VEL1_9LEPT|nr:imelysin family protein [Leptospira soteropolitanensis]MCW7493017.1 imelysin [Leptospira soteropolitanensis]MCW7500252.1 imelysin [Leptospira soteropolitanensis]MCW7522503.1 imelysin [Leptospira soteropolitanensis]MCW7526359.1 imelysin [Leptospira soteropolitanensis]MCW7529529.1 imelysin [Leptospira soteropolitanensis]
MTRVRNLTSFLTLGLLLNFCTPKKDNSETAMLAALALAASAPNQGAFLETYAQIAFQNYSDAYADVVALREKVSTFTGKASPSAQDLNEVKTYWRKARRSYLQTEVFRFSKGPIDNPALTGGVELEPLMNAWPLDEGYIDTVILAGTITKQDLIDKNAGECNGGTCPDGDTAKNISVGWHAIEYLLWGVGTAGNSTPGSTITAANFTTANGSGSAEAKQSAYLLYATEILESHLLQLKNAWDPSISNSYVSKFKASSTSFENVIRGIARLSGGEWGGERMTGVFGGDQEEEHSCFSDNTKNDFYYDAKGLENLFYGTYQGTKTINGNGLKNLLGGESNYIGERITTAEQFCLNEFYEDPSLNQTCNSSQISSRFDTMIATVNSTQSADYKIFRYDIQPAVQEIAKSLQRSAANFGFSIGDDGLVLQ